MVDSIATVANPQTQTVNSNSGLSGDAFGLVSIFSDYVAQEQTISPIEEAYQSFFARIDQNIAKQSAQRDAYAATPGADPATLAMMDYNIQTQKATRAAKSGELEAMMDRADQILVIGDPAQKQLQTSQLAAEANVKMNELKKLEFEMARQNLESEIAQTIPVMEAFSAWIDTQIQQVLATSSAPMDMSTHSFLGTLEAGKLEVQRLLDDLNNPAQGFPLSVLTATTNYTTEHLQQMIVRADEIAGELDNFNRMA